MVVANPQGRWLGLRQHAFSGVDAKRKALLRMRMLHVAGMDSDHVHRVCKHSGGRLSKPVRKDRHA